MLWRSKTSAELWGLETAQLYSDLIMQSTPLGASRLLNFQYIYITLCVLQCERTETISLAIYCVIKIAPSKATISIKNNTWYD